MQIYAKSPYMSKVQLKLKKMSDLVVNDSRKCETSEKNVNVYINIIVIKVFNCVFYTHPLYTFIHFPLFHCGNSQLYPKGQKKAAVQWKSLVQSNMNGYPSELYPTNRTETKGPVKLYDGYVHTHTHTHTVRLVVLIQLPGLQPGLILYPSELVRGLLMHSCNYGSCPSCKTSCTTLTILLPIVEQRS